MSGMSVFFFVVFCLSGDVHEWGNCKITNECEKKVSVCVLMCAAVLI